MKKSYVTTKARNTLDRNALELNEYKSDPRSYEHNWTSGWNKAWKKIEARTGFESMTSVILVQRSTNRANKPLCWIPINLLSDE